jgi:hypothetical protein
VHSNVPGPPSVNALFVMLGWDRNGFQKKHIGTRYNKLVFFHPVGSAGHVVYSGCASGAQNIKSQFFLPRWDWCRFHKKRASTCYDKLLFLHPVATVSHVVHSSGSGCKTSTQYVSCSAETGTDSTKSALVQVTPNLGFYNWWDLEVTSCI